MKFAGFDDWIPIFRIGRHTDSAGNTRDWTEADLETTVSKYDPATHEAPIVIGHPEENHPAWGWVEALKREGGTLFAKFKQVVPEFANMVKMGWFKKRSIALYPDLSLKHVGFLGAAAPAVKGLANVAFKEEEAMTIEFASRDEAKAAQESRAKKYGIAVKEGGAVTKSSEWSDVPDDEFLDPVNYRYPCPDADQTKAAASYWGREKNQAQYSSEERAKITARLDRFRKKFKIGDYAGKGAQMSLKSVLTVLFPKAKPAIEAIPDGDLIPEGTEPTMFSEAEVRSKVAAAAAKAKEDTEKEFAEKERKRVLDARKGEIKTWLDRMMSPEVAKHTPALRAYSEPILEALLESQVIEFGEKKEKLTPFQLYQRLFEAELPKLVTYSEIASRSKDVSGDAAGKLEAMIAAKRAADKTLSYSEALKAVQIENPGLAREYAEEMRLPKK